MNAGKLTERIEIQKQLISEDSNINGFNIPTWITFKKVWANKKNLYGKEYYAAKAVNYENSCDFTIRYTKELEALYDTENYKIIWKGIVFNIVDVDNIQENNAFFRIKAIKELKQ